MSDFKIWYHPWVVKQELTISRLDIAKAAFEAGVKCTRDKKHERQPEKEININN